jgi:hypothetical protein
MPLLFCTLCMNVPLVAHWNKRSPRYEPNPREKTSLSLISCNDVLAKRDLILLATDHLCWVSHLEAGPAKVLQNPFHYLLCFSRTGLPVCRNTVSCFGYGMDQFYDDCRLFFAACPAVPRPLGHSCRSCSRRGSADETLVQGNSETPAISLKIGPKRLHRDFKPVEPNVWAPFGNSIS